MKRITILTTVTMAALTLLYMQVIRADNADRQPSGTTFASCVARITYDESLMTDLVIIETLRSTQVAGKAVREALGVAPQEQTADYLLRAEPISAKTGTPRPPMGVPGMMGAGMPGGVPGRAVAGRSPYGRVSPGVGQPGAMPGGMYGGMPGGMYGGMPGGMYGGMPGGLGAGPGVMPNVPGGRTGRTSVRVPAMSMASGSRPAVLMLALHVDTPTVSKDAPPAAEELLTVTCKLLEKALRDAHEQHVEVLSNMKAYTSTQLKAARANLDALHSKQRKLIDELGEPQLTRQAVFDRLSKLLNEEQELRTQQRGHEARRKAVETQIAKLRNEIDNSIEDDPITHELRNIVKMAENKVAVTKKAVDLKNAHEEELVDAMAGLANARIRWLQRKQELKAQAGGDELVRLSHELNELAIDNMEVNEKLRFFLRQVAGVQDPALLELADQNEMLLVQIEQAKQRVMQLEFAKAAAEERMRQAEAMPPTVTVLGGEE